MIFLFIDFIRLKIKYTNMFIVYATYESNSKVRQRGRIYFFRDEYRALNKKEELENAIYIYERNKWDVKIKELVDGDGFRL